MIMFCYHWSDLFKIAQINIPTSLTTKHAYLTYGVMTDSDEIPTMSILRGMYTGISVGGYNL